ncbi:hypothetical protein [Rhodopseudomonas palustris]|uniref:hypothetical protein n=1 Tax=Rhodopseudomonas palustris TaxID=1076 RepID=UPI0039F53FA4
MKAPTLAIECGRELEISNFVPLAYFEIVATVQVAGGQFQIRHAPRERIAKREDAEVVAIVHTRPPSNHLTFNSFLTRSITDRRVPLDQNGGAFCGPPSIVTLPPPGDPLPVHLGDKPSVGRTDPAIYSPVPPKLAYLSITSSNSRCFHLSYRHVLSPSDTACQTCQEPSSPKLTSNVP